MNIKKSKTIPKEGIVVSLDKNQTLLTVKISHNLSMDDIQLQLPDILKQASTDLNLNVKDYYIIVNNSQRLFHGFRFLGEELICLFPNENEKVKVLRMMRMHKNGHMVFDSDVRQFILKYSKILNITYLESHLIGYKKGIFNWLFGGKPLNSLHQDKLIEFFDPVFSRKDKTFFEKVKTDTVKVLTLKDLPSDFKNTPNSKVSLDMFAKEKWGDADIVYFCPLISMKRSYCLYNRYNENIKLFQKRS